MIKKLAYFESVYRKGGLKSASRELDVSSPTLSRVISSLEEELGELLFINNSSRLTPTKFADILYNDVKDPINQLVSYVHKSREPKDELRIIAPTFISLNSFKQVVKTYTSEKTRIF
ncbi:LysR family transcriptional regulator [Vibrio sp. ZSDZ65]|uniref:LysR family transcriptional regulator n=1 Tax=Vibrio qingdaonensis TaxID=2829491 RepID=A0A9X3CV70_9VIBR|nr:LysR family transcriptional regulator [Vibrio qingdaonensis]MCW8349065.1 LysR family transcriptional regulator [Vibrio qingdaonensis]